MLYRWSEAGQYHVVASKQEIDEEAGVAELRQQLAALTEQRDALLAAATDMTTSHDSFDAWNRSYDNLHAAIAACPPKESNDQS